MRNDSIRRLCVAGVVGGLYAVLTLILPLYGPLQVRFSEAMTVLPFFLPETIPGLAVGCLIANLVGSPYALDWVVGTLATLLAAICTSKLRRRWLAPLPPVVCNAALIGGEIAWMEVGFTELFPALWGYHALTVGAGELLACYLMGGILLRWLPRIPYFRELMPEQRLKWIR